MAEHTVTRVSETNPFYDLIQRAYDVFDGPRPTDDYVCNCCMEPDIQSDFLKHTARDIPDRYLIDWYQAAVRTDQNSNLYVSQSLWRHLLPRVLESLAANIEISLCGKEVLLSRFPTGDRSLWFSAEWDIIAGFQNLYLDQFPFDNEWEPLDDTLCMFANGAWDADLLFDQVLHWPTDRIVQQFWRDWCAPPIRTYSIWITAFWKDKTTPLRFYTSQELQQRIEEYAFHEHTKPEMAEKALHVAALMEGYRP